VAGHVIDGRNFEYSKSKVIHVTSGARFRPLASLDP